MSLTLRALCVAGAVITFLIVCGSIRRQKIKIEDSLFWVVLSFALVLVAIFPNVASKVAKLLGFQSPSNFVFIVVIAILLAKLFMLSTEVSSLRHALTELAQEEALARAQDEDCADYASSKTEASAAAEASQE